MIFAGKIFLWLGFLSGALATVFRAPSKAVEFVKQLVPEDVQGYGLPDLSATPVPTDGWELINWTWYGVSAAVGLVGVTLIWAGKREARGASEQSKASLSEIRTSLSQAIVNVGKLQKQLDKMAPSEMVRFIDDQLADDLRIFADGRDAIASEFGLHKFADVMSRFAAGERAINRAWSAAADGYVDEVEQCVVRAHTMLIEAQKELG